MEEQLFYQNVNFETVTHQKLSKNKKIVDY